MNFMKIKLTKEQIIMLKLSNKDIKEGKLISHSQLDKADLKWLKEMEYMTKNNHISLVNASLF